MTLPWPPRELSPNARVSWVARWRVAAAYKLAVASAVGGGGKGRVGGEKGRVGGGRRAGSRAARSGEGRRAGAARSDLAAGSPRWLRGARIRAELVACPPESARKRDLDNVVAALKPCLDTVAAALGVDDSSFRPLVVDWGEPCQGGAVVLTLRAGGPPVV